MHFGNILVERTACHTLLDGRRLLGKPYRSLSAYLRNRTKSAVRYMASLEVLLAVTVIPEEEETGGDGYAGRRSELVL